MSRPAVESTLFRARRRLTEEYDELVSGRRCERVQAIITSAAEGMLGARDRRRLARHTATCQACRRHARRMGLADVEAPATVRGKLAAFVPIPAFLRRGGDSAGVRRRPRLQPRRPGVLLAGRDGRPRRRDVDEGSRGRRRARVRGSRGARGCPERPPAARPGTPSARRREAGRRAGEERRQGHLGQGHLGHRRSPVRPFGEGRGRRVGQGRLRRPEHRDHGPGRGPGLGGRGDGSSSVSLPAASAPAAPGAPDPGVSLPDVGSPGADSPPPNAPSNDVNVNTDGVNVPQGAGASAPASPGAAERAARRPRGRLVGHRRLTTDRAGPRARRAQLESEGALSAARARAGIARSTVPVSACPA